MATSQYQKSIKAINERIADVARTYGTESYYYKRFEELVKAYLDGAPESTTAPIYHYSRTYGSIALPTSEKYAENVNLQKLVTALYQVRTKGEIHREIRSATGASDMQEIQEMARSNSIVSNFMREHGGEKYETAEMESFFQGVGSGSLSIEEQLRFINEWESLDWEDKTDLPTTQPL